ncbi:MAG TPA: adenylyl-sulfate kinase [Verrucomicrobiae bacterium]|nr:adenylyl-sulfate kinase [Verrucomicrobiae bacterium]
MRNVNQKKTGQQRPNIHPPAVKIPLAEREQRNRHRGCVVWLTGLSASGKSTIAAELERQLFQLGCQTFVLDGDSMRHGLCNDLGFSHRDRSENIRRAGEVAKLFSAAGFICIAAFISPYRADRDMVRAMLAKGRFVEIFVNAPLKVCEQRDPKGLYAKARERKIKNFTGISSAYEPPLHPEIEVRTDKLNLPDTIKKILRRLQKTCNIGEGKK